MRVREYYELSTGDRREELILSRSEQETEYQRCLQNIIDDPRKYLDSLESLDEFKVNWKKYETWKNGKRSC